MGEGLTDAVVKGLTCSPGKKDALYTDAVLSGFSVRVNAGGSKVFLLQYKAAGKVRRVTLGTWGAEATCADARRGDLLKALHWDGQGLCLYAKRLELARARFVWPQTDSGTITLTAAQVSMLLEGIDWRMTSTAAYFYFDDVALGVLANYSLSASTQYGLVLSSASSLRWATNSGGGYHADRL